MAERARKMSWYGSRMIKIMLMVFLRIVYFVNIVSITFIRIHAGGAIFEGTATQ